MNLRTAVPLGLSLLAASCATTLATRADVAEVIEAERAFARLADEIGVRPAFTANFADDAVWMLPAPTSLAAAFAARPAPADPRALRLEWSPAIAGIAASGDLGFTSGPSRASLRDGSRPPAHGLYMSMWKRLPEGRWRVALDVGVQQQDEVSAAMLAPSPPVPAAPSARSAGHDAPLDSERGGSWDGSRLRALLADDARLIRNEAPVARGRLAVAESLGAQTIALKPLGGALSKSADLAYSYGEYEAGPAHGYYVHVWTRDAGGDWRLAIVVRP
jgi:ketosteroid isomerase-like protein